MLFRSVRAGGFVPVRRAAGPDSGSRADDSGCADLTQLAALRVGLHAAAVVRRAVGRLVAAHFGVDSGAPVEFVVAVPAVAVVLRDERPVQLVAGRFGPDLAVSDFPGYGLADLARGRDAPARA